MSTLYIRNLPDDVVQRIHRASSARQMTLAKYIAALVKLHDAMRAHADSGQADIEAELTVLGLQTITQ